MSINSLLKEQMMEASGKVEKVNRLFEIILYNPLKIIKT